MKLLKKISKKFKTKSIGATHPKDVKIEQKLSESALVEIELRDR